MENTKAKLSWQEATKLADMLDDFCLNEFHLIYLKEVQINRLAALSNQLDLIADQFADSIDNDLMALLAEISLIWIRHK